MTLVWEGCFIAGVRGHGLRTPSHPSFLVPRQADRVGSPAATARHPDADRAPRAASPVEPLRHRPREAAACAAGRFDGTDAGRQLERPGRARNGKPEHSFRPQRPPRPCLPGGQSGPARAEPASRQPQAPRPRALHPGGVDQRAGRRLDPVRGARLDQPRHGPGEAHLARARQGRHLARTERWRSRARCRTRARPPTGRRPSTRPTTPTGGTARRSTGTTRPSRSLRAPGRTASCDLGDDGLHPEALDELLDPVGPRGNFWVGLAILQALFTREHNAICDALRREHPTGATSSSMTRPASSTRR